MKENDIHPLVPDIKIATDWFVDIIGNTNWNKRKKEVIQYFQRIKRINVGLEHIDSRSEQVRMAFHEDWIAWYLYLAESIVERPTVDEPWQSSRILYFFATIGKYSEELKSVGGYESKLHDLLRTNDNQPDSILFELIVAIYYVRQGWYVEFIPEESMQKTPDMLIRRGPQEFFVECKRQAKTPDYSVKERSEWLKRWAYIASLVDACPISILVDIKFKIEVIETELNVLAESLILFLQSNFKITSFENEQIKIVISIIDMTRIISYMEEWRIRYPSPKLHSLFDKDFLPHNSYALRGEFRLIETSCDDENILNIFVDSIKKVACAKWICASTISIEKKAKDVKKLLVKAVNQAPRSGKTLIHIAYEALYGPEIEFVRAEKIKELISDFDFGDKDIAFVYCHSFQVQCLADNEIDFAETVLKFPIDNSTDHILNIPLLISFEDSETTIGTAYWEQDLIRG